MQSTEDKLVKSGFARKYENAYKMNNHFKRIGLLKKVITYITSI